VEISNDPVGFGDGVVVQLGQAAGDCSGFYQLEIVYRRDCGWWWRIVY
jgi:hypothetical protein